jgi:DNA polymerase-1
MAKDKKKRLIIIDGNALIHRSFHALPFSMATKNGEITNAVYGFTTVLLKAIREFKPDYVALTLDRKGPTFRHEAYKEYKAHRVKAPDELYEQIPRVKEVAGVFNIPIYEKEGFEADDLIGTITKKTDSGVEKIILTGDLDTLQLIDDDTKVYTMSHGLSDSVTYDEKAVRGRFGLEPEQMIDYKALRGDPSDNIPGVRGIGEKTAIELLKQFKSLDGVYKNIESKKIKDRVRGLLKEYKKNAYLSKKLATIKRDAPINFNLAQARFGIFNKEEVVKLFSELEFKSLLPRVQGLEVGGGEEAKLPRGGSASLENKFERNKKEFKYYLVDDEKKFKSFINKLKKQRNFTFDTEISSFDPLTAKLLGVSFSWKEGEAYYVNFQLLINNFQSQNANLFNYNKEDKQSVKVNQVWIEELKPIFENEKIRKYGHNIKFDIRVMKNNGVDVGGVEFDTMIASYLLNPGTRQHNLDALTFSELGFEKITKDELLGSAFAKATADKKGKEKILKSQIGFADVETEKLYLYSCEDADFTFRLVRKLSKQLREQSLEKLFKDIEMPLAPVLAQMEDNGIKIDIKYLEKIKKGVDEKIKHLERKIKKEAGVDFNINSTQQLREVLFEKLNIPSLEVGRTKTGLSTAALELEKLKDQHQIIRMIQEYRELNKLTTTYINALPKLVNKKTSRLHTSFNQTITATGRLSSSEPNLQNIPIRTEWGRKIRRAFVAENGYKLVSLDYSQIELRLAAHMSGDKKMIKAFLDGADIHTATAAEINGVEFEKVTYAMRREAKAINFGILYGQGPHGLSQAADIQYARAKEYIDNYFKAYQGIKRFIDETIQKARDNGYAKTLFGRRRYLPEINSSVLQVRKAAERMAINTPLQGTAADMIKIAMIDISRMLNELKSNESEFDVKMLLQVHDELLFEIKEDKVKEAARAIKKIMEGVLKLKVPIEVDVEVGENWGNLEKLEV